MPPLTCTFIPEIRAEKRVILVRTGRVWFGLVIKPVRVSIFDIQDVLCGSLAVPSSPKEYFANHRCAHFARIQQGCLCVDQQINAASPPLLDSKLSDKALCSKYQL